MEARDVLRLAVRNSDIGNVTIGEYLRVLLATVWEEREGFSGKRPFGNSGWQYDLYGALVKGGAMQGQLDEDGYVEELDTDEADRMISACIALAFADVDDSPTRCERPAS